MNIFNKKTIIIIIVMILFTCGYFYFVKFKNIETAETNNIASVDEKLIDPVIAEKLIVQGAQTVIDAIFENTENCKIVKITNKEITKELADVECIVKIINDKMEQTQAQTQASVAGELAPVVEPIVEEQNE